ncbi:alpha-amylase family glycosyl hydrolase [Ilumatobacter sp.]|uniref:alpha-amylase family glycosyl hydrolase n=1 Tax=Ilumatobacter sp. TaxID=1967498 RepID=UPI003AF8E0CD
MPNAPSPSDVRRQVLSRLYGDRAASIDEEVRRIIGQTTQPRPAMPWDERTAWVITYPSQFRSTNETPLETLRHVVREYLRPDVTGVHVLPFHPSSSDGGFSITAFDAVDPAHGTWDDIRELASTTDVMADAVVNHASAQGEWFRRYLAGDPEYRGFFREVEPDADLKAVVRPRTSPIPTTFERHDGTSTTVWATFSADQIDLDYRNPSVLLRATEVILSYVEAGASAIRLDAVAFLWKQEGTTSIHMPETHDIIRFFRACLDEIDPEIALITETNVPHDENISYLAPAPIREAQAVYQFPLPPLVLHSFVAGSALALREWARRLTFERADTTFLNFLASHDGVGVRPVEGLLRADERERLVETCRSAGGVVNTRLLADGTEVPYELTGTWFSFMATGHGEDEALARHLASHAIPLALRGVPLLYVHSLVASQNDAERYRATDLGRDLNRATFDMATVRQALADPSMRPSRSWAALRAMLRWRSASAAFRPDAEQVVLDAPDEIFAIRRTGPGGHEAIVAVNVSDHAATLDLAGGDWVRADDGRNVAEQLALPRWSYAWLRRADP